MDKKKSKGSIRSLLRNPRYLKKRARELKDEITPKELFMSPGYKGMLTAIARGVAEAYGIDFEVRVIWDKPSGKVAYVQKAGSKKYLMTINANNAMVDGKELTMAQLHAVNVALAMHEGGHVLYTPFNSTREMGAALSDGGESLLISESLKKLLENKKAANAVTRLFFKLTNSAEDGFLEPQQMKRFPGYAKDLELLRDIQLNDSWTLQAQEDGGLTVKQMVLNTYLTYAKYGTINLDEDAEIGKKAEEVIDIIEPILPLLDDIRDETDKEKRLQKELETVDEIVLKLIKPEKEKPEKSEESESPDEDTPSDGSDGSDGSSDSTDDTDETDNDTDGESGSDDTGNSKDGSDESADGFDDLDPEDIEDLADMLDDLIDDDIAEPEEDIDSDGAASGDEEPDVEDDTTDDLDSLMSEEAERKAKKETHSKLSDERGEIADSMEVDHVHDGHELVMTDVSDIPSSCYNELLSSTRKMVRRLTQEFAQEIRDMQDGSTDRGLFWGTRLDAPHRADLKKFSADIAPEDIPDMAICWLFDMSGSTYCEGKIEEFRRLAFVAYQFTEQFGIRSYIYGHDESFSDSSQVRLHLFSDPDLHDGKALMRISNMNAMENNRDGLPLQFCCEQMLKNETAKNLYVITISDGAPAAEAYGFTNGRADIQNVIRKYSRMGINFITAGVGSDCENIKAIYCDGLDRVAADYLSIEDPGKLAKTFVGILKKKMAA